MSLGREHFLPRFPKRSFRIIATDGSEGLKDHRDFLALHTGISARAKQTLGVPAGLSALGRGVPYPKRLGLPFRAARRSESHCCLVLFNACWGSDELIMGNRSVNM